MEKMKSRDHPVFKLLPRPVAGICNYKLRKNSEKFLLFNASITCRTKWADSFLHLDLLSKLLQVILLLFIFVNI